MNTKHRGYISAKWVDGGKDNFGIEIDCNAKDEQSQMLLIAGIAQAVMESNDIDMDDFIYKLVAASIVLDIRQSGSVYIDRRGFEE